MDYEAMWTRMRNEMKYLQDKDVGILALVSLGYMDFIEEIERIKESEKNDNDNDSKEGA